MRRRSSFTPLGGLATYLKRRIDSLFFKSIRFSLTLRYSLTLAVILVLFSSFLYLTITKQFYREVDKELYTIAEALASPTLEPFRNSAPSVFDQVLEDFIGPRANGKFV